MLHSQLIPGCSCSRSLWSEKHPLRTRGCWGTDANLDRGKTGGCTFFSYHPLLPSFSLSLLKIVLIVLQYVAWPWSELQAGAQSLLCLLNQWCVALEAVCAPGCPCVHHSGLPQALLTQNKAFGLHVLLIKKSLPFDPSWRICLISFCVGIKQLSECVIWTSIQRKALIFMRIPSSIFMRPNLRVFTFLCCSECVFREQITVSSLCSSLALSFTACLVYSVSLKQKLEWLAGVLAQQDWSERLLSLFDCSLGWVKDLPLDICTTVSCWLACLLTLP